MKFIVFFLQISLGFAAADAAVNAPIDGNVVGGTTTVGEAQAAPCEPVSVIKLCRPIFRVVNPKDLGPEKVAAISNSMVLWFLDAYKALTKEALGIKYSSKEEWLKATFDEELDDFLAQKTPIHWFLSEVSGQGIGVIIIEPDPELPNCMHVRHMALHPNFRHQEGKESSEQLKFGHTMVRAIKVFLDAHYPATNTVVVNVRKLNLLSQHFLKSLGFVQQETTYHGYNPDHYLGFRFVISS